MLDECVTRHLKHDLPATTSTPSKMQDSNIANSFDAVPNDEDGLPLLVATTETEYWLYLNWLADYLHRPDAFPEAHLSAADAALEMIGIEIEIASAIWSSPYDDYPPVDQLPQSGARHADQLHREELAAILSGIPDHDTRLQLLDEFYAELNRDARK